MTTTVTNGTSETGRPIELAIALPQNPGIEINLHLTILSKTIMLFLTSTAIETGRQGSVPMGSYVYAMPDRYNPNEPMTTTLYYAASSVDFATRMAKLLARKTSLPCYVGNSMNLSASLGGGSVEDEMEAFRAVVAAVTKEIEVHKANTTAL